MNTARFKPSAIIFYSPLVTALPGLSAPGQSSERPATEKPPHGSQAVLPTVQKNQMPSTMILKYMEGISKRIVKIQALPIENKRVDSFFTFLWLPGMYCLSGLEEQVRKHSGGITHQYPHPATLPDFATQGETSKFHFILGAPS